MYVHIQRGKKYLAATDSAGYPTWKDERSVMYIIGTLQL